MLGIPLAEAKLLANEEDKSCGFDRPPTDRGSLGGRTEASGEVARFAACDEEAATEVAMEDDGRATSRPSGFS